MGEEILSVAIFESLPGKDKEAIATLRELFAILSAGGYSRDVLYRDAHMHFVLTRYWPGRAGRSRSAAVLGENQQRSKDRSHL
jgi:hypothetical protein